MAEPALLYRLYAPDDAPALTRLYERVWPGREGHQEYIDWAFTDPRGGSSTVLAVEPATGRIVGCRGATRWPFSVGGESLLVRQFHGTCVDPESRRLGIFTEMNRRSLALFEEEGGDLIYNVSVDESRSGYERLGWVYRPGLRRLIKPVRRLRFIRALMGGRKRIGGRPVVEPATEPIPYLDTLGSCLQGRRELLADSLAVDYTEASTTWRFSKRGSGHRIHVSSAGAVVYRFGRRGPLREAYIGDVWPRSADPSLMRDVLTELIDIERPDMITFVITREHPLYGACRRFGFLPDPGGDLNLGTKAVSGRGERLLDSQPLAITALDIDTF